MCRIFLSFIIVVPMSCMLSVYVNFALVNIFLRFGGCLQLFINLSCFVASCIFGLALRKRNVFQLLKRNLDFLG